MALRRSAKVEKEIEEPAAEQVEETKAETQTEDETLPFDGDSEEAEAEARAEEEKVEEAKKAAPAPGTSVIPRNQQATAMAEHAGHKTTVSTDAALTNELQGSGFEGLDDGFGAYPIVSLKNEGVFEDTDQESWGTEFECVIISSKAKFVVGNTRCEKRDEEVVYTYDGITDTQGVPIQETIEKWADNGWGYETRPYTDVMAEITSGDRSGEVVILSLPKTSRTKYTGYIKTNMRRRRLEPNQYVTKVYVGDKITNVDFPYYPWRFKYVGELED